MHKLCIALTLMVLTSMTPAIAVSSSSTSIPAKAETSAPDLSGSWTVRWISNDSRNPMTLTQNAMKFTGQYRNDAMQYCAVSGDMDPESQLIKLQIQCPKWDINMEGFPTLDGSTVVGNYLAYGKAVGGFIMTK